MNALRVALLTEIPAPFRIPLFNALAATPGIALDVLFLSDRDPVRPYPVYADEFAFGWSILGGAERHRGRWVVLSRGVGRELRRIRPDVVIVGGYNQPAFWQALAWARLRRRPVVAWSESTARDARPGSAALEVAKRLFLRRCRAVFVPGRASAEYMALMGIPAERVVVAPNAVDDAIFGQRVAELRGDRAALRRRLDVDGPCVLTACRLDPEKGVDVLIRAAPLLPDGAIVAVAGDGSRAAALRDEAERVAPGRIRFLGRLDRDQLAEWYAAADAFALASRSDQWGMVLNEAAAAGLPIVATEAPGAAWDLVEPGVNGARVPVDDAPALAAALSELLADEKLRAAAGRRSRELAQRFTADAWAGVVAALVRRVVR